MAKRNVEIEGLGELMKKLTALGGNVPKATHDGLIKGGEVVQGVAKKLCQVDTGRLRNSIEVSGEKKHKYTYSVGKGKSKQEYEGIITGGGESAVVVGTNVEYAPYVEFGTGLRGDPTVAHRQDWEGQPPQPFLSPALALSEEKVKQRIAAELKKSIREAVNDG